MSPTPLSLFLAALALIATVHVQGQVCRMDLALVIDRSGSIWTDQPNQAQGQQNWQNMRGFAANVIQSVAIGPNDAYVAMVAFSGSAELIFNLGQLSKADMTSQANNLFYDVQNGGPTYTDLALELVRTQVFNGQGNDRTDATNVIVLLTEGAITPGRETATFQSADLMKAGGVEIMTVGVTNNINFAQLNEIASRASNVYNVTEFNELASQIANIVDQACSSLQPTCPTPNPYNIAFSAYGTHDQMYSQMGYVMFTVTYVNQGNQYNTNTGVFTCSCTGMYEFYVKLAMTNPGFTAVIVRDADVVSTEVVSTPTNGMSTSTIVRCQQGQQVWVRVETVQGGNSMTCGYTGGLQHAFTGKFLFAVQ